MGDRAFAWNVRQRAALANDPMNLLAVDASANRQKGDGDAATWLPSNKDYRCAYVARQVSVKAKYRLWVTAPEKAAATRVLASCPQRPAVEDSGAPTRVSFRVPDPSAQTSTPQGRRTTRTATPPGPPVQPRCSAVTPVTGHTWTVTGTERGATEESLGGSVDSEVGAA